MMVTQARGISNLLGTQGEEARSEWWQSDMFWYGGAPSTKGCVMNFLKGVVSRLNVWWASRNLMWVGICLTTLYVSGAFVVMGTRFTELVGLPLNELGDFFAGAFGPPAFLWLVVGQIQQGKDIARNAESYERSLEPSLTLRYSRTEETDTGPADFFVVSNFGAYCSKVSVRVSGGSLKDVTTYISPLANGSEQEFGVGQHLPRDGFYKVRFSYEKQSGRVNERCFAFFRSTIGGVFNFVVVDDVGKIPETVFDAS
jgi:hypothetical protein